MTEREFYWRSSALHVRPRFGEDDVGMPVLEALVLSLQKWEAVVDKIRGGLPAHRVDDGGAGTCGCCARVGDVRFGCDECPLQQRNSSCCCEPYFEWVFKGASLDVAERMVAHIQQKIEDVKSNRPL